MTNVNKCNSIQLKEAMHVKSRAYKKRKNKR